MYTLIHTITTAGCYTWKLLSEWSIWEQETGHLFNATHSWWPGRAQRPSSDATVVEKTILVQLIASIMGAQAGSEAH